MRRSTPMSSRNLRIELSPESQRDFIGILRDTGSTTWVPM
jgi:hypothetical protein